MLTVHSCGKSTKSSSNILFLKVDPVFTLETTQETLALVQNSSTDGQDVSGRTQNDDRKTPYFHYGHNSNAAEREDLCGQKALSSGSRKTHRIFKDLSNPFGVDVHIHIVDKK